MIAPSQIHADLIEISHLEGKLYSFLGWALWFDSEKKLWTGSYPWDHERKPYERIHVQPLSVLPSWDSLYDALHFIQDIRSEQVRKELSMLPR